MITEPLSHIRKTLIYEDIFIVIYLWLLKTKIHKIDIEQKNDEYKKITVLKLVDNDKNVRQYKTTEPGNMIQEGKVGDEKPYFTSNFGVLLIIKI